MGKINYQVDKMGFSRRCCFGQGRERLEEKVCAKVVVPWLEFGVEMVDNMEE